MTFQNQHFITYKNTTLSLKEWSKKLNISYNTLYLRIVLKNLPPERAFIPPPYRHGGTKNGKTKEYVAWQDMKARCNNPGHKSYHRYGGRGIRVCDTWINSFQQFSRDMGIKPEYGYSLDRIDNNGNYCPENCRWATRKEQDRNRSTLRLLTHNGNTHCVTEWEELLGFKRGVIDGRLKRGWPVEKILTTPVKPRKQHDRHPGSSR